MAHSVSAEYTTEESKPAGAKPKFYVAFMRTKKSYVTADYTAGSHTNTEFTASKLQLSAGQSSGNWISAVTDTAHLVANAIIDLITWTEVLNGGTVTVEIRSAAASGDVPAATLAEYTNNTLDHTARFRYFQIKISFTSVNGSPTVAALVLRHKALIPRDEYVSLGSVNYGVSFDFNSISAGGATIQVDNTLDQWDKRDSASYIYQKTIYFQKLEIWAGFELADTTEEWLLQFLGEIESIQVGGETTATITARDFLYRKLMNTKIGRPDSDGMPSPYMAGKRYRVLCIETDTGSHIFSFYCQQSISSIDETYVRDSTSNKWETASPSGTSTANKTVTFAADPAAEVAVDITIDTNDHPCDIITDVIENELSLEADEYDATTIATTKTNSGADMAIGVSFDNISIMQAFQLLGQLLDAAIFIEGGVLKVISYYPDTDESFTFDDSDHKNLSIADSVSEVQNTASIFYGDYDDDKTNYLEIQTTDSVTDYGELSRQDFSFKYSDPVSLISTSVAGGVLGRWLGRQDDQYEIIKFSLPLEILAVEIMDIVTLTASKHTISALKTQAYSKSLNLDDLSGTLTVLFYPGAQWLYWNDADPTEDLRYLLDSPVSAADEEYKSYYW